MGRLLHRTKTGRPVHLLLSLLLLLSSNQEKYLAEGRSLFKLLEIANVSSFSFGLSLVDTSSFHLQSYVTVMDWMQGRGEEVGMARALIGSRPPRCEGKCTSCGHCEAVQVPVVPQVRNGGGHFFNTITSKGDESSNYKPMNWKCKCGDTLHNP
ncbi:EPIDERMAL PATTERNING FACTOR-like protein 2 isoform X1 [Phoenix dactylifera]|uniref:Epidermal patterning factor-like protein n=1 Tax=Phoenix dactylifera TaxID=42345 RepID=A0A8B7MS35_PHODC|nr:EPIDERMAL PATTERNING FACTOR-like protein 2 isoform X1 [Phoenix dactylifera]